MFGLFNAFVPYKNLIIAGAILLTLFGFYAKGHHDGAERVQEKWDAANAKATVAVLEAERGARAREQAAVELANNAQEGGSNAIKSVYDYYAKHPTIVYRGVRDNATARAGKPVPEASACPASDSQDTADARHATAGSQSQVQVIEPDLVARCADTTIQALTCREYVERLVHLYN